MGFKYGIEHELALVHPDGQFADHSSLSYDELRVLIDAMPDDAPRELYRDAEGIMRKRWYVEGFERFNDDGSLFRYDPKGLEVRTGMCGTVEEVLAELLTAIAELDAVLARHHLRSAIVGFNPVRSEYLISPPLTDWERGHRLRSPEDRTEYLHMSTYGPDLNLSSGSLSADDVVDVGRKLTYYSPWLVPFSFSSPFRDGAAWGGLSARTHMRTGRRPAVLVYVDESYPRLPSDPSLVRVARLPSQVGRIEFKAFDAIGDLALYGELISLLTGLVLDQTLPGRRTTPDAAAHRHVATVGLADDAVHHETGALLTAAEAALADRPADLARMAGLRARWTRRESAASVMLAAHAAGASVAEVIAASATPAPR